MVCSFEKIVEKWIFPFPASNSVSLLNSGFPETIADSFDDFAALLLKNLRTSPVFRVLAHSILTESGECMRASQYLW